MDLEACAGNFTGCLTSLGLKYCDVDKDVCQQRGTCITTIFPTDVSICMCSVCYYGARCENELFSKNLWTTALATLSSPSGMLFATKFFATFFASIQIINSLLCLQTYFSSKKIRITNVGVYLILNGLISFILALEFFTQSIILWLIPNIPLVEYSKTTCLVDQKFVNATLTYIWGWSVFFIALERTLVECYHYSLYDSRKRSLIVSILVCTICGLTTIPGIFTVKNIPEDQLSAVAQLNLLSTSCINFTSLGYTIYKIIFCIHVYGTLASYIILSIIVLVHMLRHRKRISPTSKTIQNIRRILRKHRDFFLPLIATAICSIPMIVIYESMTCAKASKVNSLPYLMLIFGQIFSILPTSFSFFGYVYLPNVYRTAFWEKSLVGKSLTKLKQFITNRYQNFKIVFNKADSSVTVVSSTIH